ncbi:MAG: GPW/gp25 family protein [Candidatus Schekmanbacteria bacterium]|nr:GPW/gp25 family protein [Candidatus Schekmanbacteria bacterium]
MNTDFLGKGIKFPFQFNVIGGTETSVAVSEKYEHINESLQQILATSPGERVMLPEFGSRLRELLFEPNNAVLKTLARVYVIDAIKRWEKRVTVKEVYVDDSPQNLEQGLINIHIGYEVIKDQVRGNMVFPFYLGQLQ